MELAAGNKALTHLAGIAIINQLFLQAPSEIKTAYAKCELLIPSLIISFVENKEKVQPYFGHPGFQLDSEEAEYINSVMEIGREMIYMFSCS